MVKFSKFVSDNFKTLFFVFISGLLVTGALTERDKYLLVTKNAPNAIISWELNTSNYKRDLILLEWSVTYKNALMYGNHETPDIKPVTGLDTALLQNNADYVFIIFYVGFLLICIIRLKKRDKCKDNFNWLYFTIIIFTVLAGVLDYFENFGTARIIDSYKRGVTLPEAWIVGLPSTVKWTLIIIVVVVIIYKLILFEIWLKVLEKITDYFRNALKILWRFRVIFIGLFAMFFLLYESDQGQDLLLTLNEEKTGEVLFLLSTSIIALLCWYLPKLIENERPMNYHEFFTKSVDFVEDETSKKRPALEVDTSRLLGAAGFLIPAIGILQAMDNFHIDYWLSGVPPLLILVIVLIIYQIVLQRNWIDNLFKTGDDRVRWKALIVTIILLFIFMWVLGFNEVNRKPYNIVHLCVELFILSFIFLIIVTLRTCDKIFLKLPIGPLITLSGLACLVFFIALNFQEFLSNFIYNSRYFTVPFVFFAIAGYLLFFTYLLFIGKKTRVTWITIIFLWAIIGSSSSITNFHKIAILTKRTPNHPEGIASGQYAIGDSLTFRTRQWLLKREKEIEKYTYDHKRNYPVYFVNAYGGGIRATVWTTMVIGTLDMKMRADKDSANKLGFQHYAFSYSGASGGTLGLTLLTASRHTRRSDFSKDIALYPENSLKLYRTDNLTSDIIALIGRDLIYSSFGLNGISDRARLMEMNWEQNAKFSNINLKNTIGNVWKTDTAFEIPLLFSNTYEINSGKKGIVAPVILNSMDFPSTIFVRQKLGDNSDLRMSTAGLLSARFPYVSPTGKLDTNMHFTDGGTIENSGAETSLQIIEVFERVRKELVKQYPVFNKISINLLSLPNSIPKINSPTYDSEFFELLGPPIGALHVGSSNQAKAELINQNISIARKYKYLQVQPTYYKISNKSFWPVLPLGWQISNAALEDLQQNALISPAIKKVLDNFQVNK